MQYKTLRIPIMNLFVFYSDGQKLAQH